MPYRNDMSSPDIPQIRAKLFLGRQRVSCQPTSFHHFDGTLNVQPENMVVGTAVLLTVRRLFKGA
jgi:hypothetical protein